jgi:hypothetical protein
VRVDILVRYVRIIEALCNLVGSVPNFKENDKTFLKQQFTVIQNDLEDLKMEMKE